MIAEGRAVWGSYLTPHAAQYDEGPLSSQCEIEGFFGARFGSAASKSTHKSL